MEVICSFSKKGPSGHHHMGMGQNPIPLVNIKIAGKWMFIRLKMVCIGIDPYPYLLFVLALLSSRLLPLAFFRAILSTSSLILKYIISFIYILDRVQLVLAKISLSQQNMAVEKITLCKYIRDFGFRASR
jgi:hypothetical protein